jgi:hypothetical protein
MVTFATLLPTLGWAGAVILAFAVGALRARGVDDVE